MADVSLLVVSCYFLGSQVPLGKGTGIQEGDLAW
jgi:hypothetical protein